MKGLKNSGLDGTRTLTSPMVVHFMSTGIQENFFLFTTDFSISYHEKWKSLADSSRCRFFLSCHLCDKDKNTMHYDLSTQRPHADPH